MNNEGVTNPSKWRVEKLPAAYAAYYPLLTQIARENGYALAVHGSCQRDFDLIAVPWIESAADPFTLIKAFKEAVGGVTHTEWGDEHFPDFNPSSRPHGRLSFALHFTNRGSHGPYLDIGVMPRVPTGDGDYSI